ncbi:hypothetical protein Goshw_021345 [Gossypium schwendimanii]|uniref:Transmembrane protein n=3 Tax=Gossypium TaxID=3633 RepID=A0A7J9LXN7_GOSSC|nr:hypothetical protein [Gossypium aridum]MBA0718073.1 hypothetical protein [Gossypium laxum]MBA0863458.1 hypothetical protein [Gossypium schwendimanii]
MQIKAHYKIHWGILEFESWINQSAPLLQPQTKKTAKMVKVASYFAMAFGAFIFWQTMDKVHVWIALHQDEKKERLEREAEIRRMREELLQQAKQNDRLP